MRTFVPCNFCSTGIVKHIPNFLRYLLFILLVDFLLFSVEFSVHSGPGHFPRLLLLQPLPGRQEFNAAQWQVHGGIGDDAHCVSAFYLEDEIRRGLATSFYMKYLIAMPNDVCVNWVAMKKERCGVQRHKMLERVKSKVEPDLNYIL